MLLAIMSCGHSNPDIKEGNDKPVRVKEMTASGSTGGVGDSYSGTIFFRAIVSATMAISIKFFPFLITMTGMFRDFLTDFPWAILLILTISLIVAELLVPFLQYRIIKQPIYAIEREFRLQGEMR